MNIQQLNGSGQAVWVFVVTAITALLITAGIWYLSEAANTYRHWHRKCAELDTTRISHRYGATIGIKQPNFDMAERVAMIVWLQRKGYLSWMRDTGAGWKILLNSSEPMMVALKRGGYNQKTSAGDLVSRYSFGQLEEIDLRLCKPADSERSNSTLPS